MATVGFQGNGIRVRFQIRREQHTTTIRLKPTQANLRAVKAVCRDLEYRLLAGEPWPVIRAELRGEAPPAESKALSYYAQHMLDTASVKRSTLLEYQSTYNRIWSAFNDKPVTGLLKSELESHLATFGLTAKAQKNAISVLRRCLNVAKEDGTIDKAPTDNWRVKADQKPAIDPYTEHERDQLLAALCGVAKAYFTVGFYTGMRTGELLAVENRHCKPPVIRVEQQRNRQRLQDYTKTNVARDAHLPAHIWTQLEPYRFGKWLFAQDDGSPFTEANPLMDEWRKAHTKSGVRLRVDRAGKSKKYPWRHTYISIALSKGIPPSVVARQCGHDEKTMWDNYAEFIPQGDEYDQLERAFQQSETTKRP